MHCPTCKETVDGRKKAPQLLPKRPSKTLTNASVKRAIESFVESGYSYHSGNATMLQYIINYCEHRKIEYVVKALPGSGYWIQKSEEYNSYGNPEVTDAIRFLLAKGERSRQFGGPCKWSPKFLRTIGKFMADYAKKRVNEVLYRELQQTS